MKWNKSSRSETLFFLNKNKNISENKLFEQIEFIKWVKNKPTFWKQNNWKIETETNQFSNFKFVFTIYGKIEELLYQNFWSFPINTHMKL